MELFLSSVISVLFVVSPLEKSKTGRKSALAPCEDTTFLLHDPPWPQANRITSTMSATKCYLATVRTLAGILGIQILGPRASAECD